VKRIRRRVVSGSALSVSTLYARLSVWMEVWRISINGLGKSAAEKRNRTQKYIIYIYKRGRFRALPAWPNWCLRLRRPWPDGAQTWAPVWSSRCRSGLVQVISLWQNLSSHPRRQDVIYCSRYMFRASSFCSRAAHVHPIRSRPWGRGRETQREHSLSLLLSSRVVQKGNHRPLPSLCQPQSWKSGMSI